MLTLDAWFSCVSGSHFDTTYSTKKLSRNTPCQTPRHHFFKNFIWMALHFYESDSTSQCSCLENLQLSGVCNVSKVRVPAWKTYGIRIHLPCLEKLGLTRSPLCVETSINTYIRIYSNSPKKQVPAVAVNAGTLYRSKHRWKETLLCLLTPKRIWGIEHWYKRKPKTNNNAKVMRREAFLFFRPRGLFSHAHTCPVA